MGEPRVKVRFLYALGTPTVSVTMTNGQRANSFANTSLWVILGWENHELCCTYYIINTKKLLEIEKEIVREVVRGDKHNLRKSANRNAQISVIHSAHWTDLCFAICRFSQVVFVTSNNFTHNLLFLIPIVFSINLIPFFDICSVDYLLFFHPGCSGMCCFTWAAARSQQLLFVALAAGLWCFTAGCPRQISPLPPTPSENSSVLPDGRKHKTVVFSQSNALRE